MVILKMFRWILKIVVRNFETKGKFLVLLLLKKGKNTQYVMGYVVNSKL